MDTEHLKTFVEVVQQGSFAAAARKFDIDPSVVTRAIASLERDLGLRLLERTTRQLVLTEAGKLYHENACKLLRDLQQAADEARDLAGRPAGIVRVTTSVTYGYAVILPLLPALREAHPALEIDLLLSDSIVDLLAERVDVALRLRQEADTSLIGTRLAKIRYHVCASPEYLKRQAGPGTPADLAERDCLRCSLRAYHTQWKFRDPAGAVQTVNVGGWLVVSNSLGLHRAALDGHGPALLADWLVADDLAAGRLIDLFPDHEATPTDFDNAVWLLHTSRSYVPKRVRAFIEFIKQRMRGADPGLGASVVHSTLSKDRAAATYHLLRDARQVMHSLV
ncbi:MAG TPA: LysR family transcriptional regulator [Stellaceae bacterium]|nr:LysR family transcriptional regulator [Stellaceae bacterium]